MDLDFMGSLQAILAIPGAIQAIRELRAGDPSRAKSADLAATISEKLLEFSKIHEWLLEAKELHDNLNTVILMMHLLNSMRSKALHNKQLDHSHFDYDQFEHAWKAIRYSGIQPTLACMTSLKTFGDMRLVLDNATHKPKSGYDKFILFTDAVNELEHSFNDFNQDDINTYKSILSSIKKLDDTANPLLLEINREIKKRAECIAECLQRLHGGLIHARSNN